MVLCARVKKNNAETAKRLLISKGAFNKEFNPISDEGYVYFPVSIRIRSNLIDSFVEKKLIGFDNVRISNLPGFDIVGDIAIFEMPKDALKLGKSRTAAEKQIASDILRQHKNIKTVAVKTGAISGVYRLRKFRVVAGRKSTITIHKEHGCAFKLDAAKAYYSPRLSFERKRIDGLVGEHETVIVPFAGVGPFAIIIAKSHPDARVIANEFNPSAFRYLKENIRLNKVFNVTAKPGDAKNLLKKYAGTADRVLMPLPMSSNKFLSLAFGLCKPGGIVHMYKFTDSMSACERMVIEHAKEAGRKVRILGSRSVREYSPKIIEVVVDFKVL